MSERVDYLPDLFRAAGRRLTRQRRIILETLQRSGGHLEAQALHSRVKDRYPSISLATVYRTLAVLREMGLVEQHLLGEEHSHFETSGESHHHFTCLGCGEVVEFDTEMVKEMIRKLHERRGIRVTAAHLQLSGHCAQCQAEDGEATGLDRASLTRGNREKGE